MVITLERGQLISQLGAQPKVPLFAASDGLFFAKLVKADLEFVRDTTGGVIELILHQNGNDLPMRRLSDAEIKKMADDAAAKAAFAAQRYKGQEAQAGSEEALRRLLGELRAGEPKYDQMMPEAAQTTRQQADRLKDLLGRLCMLKSVEFVGVLLNGTDDYVLKFDNGEMECESFLRPTARFRPWGTTRCNEL